MKKVRIIHAANPQPGALALDNVALVQEDGEANCFEKGNFLDEIMIAQYRVARLPDVRHEPPHQLQGEVVLPGDLVVIVTRQHRDLVVEPIDALDDDIYQLWIQIAVKIGQLHEAVAVERLRQFWQNDLVVDDLNIQKIPFPNLVKTGKLERMPNKRIHGDDSLEHEEALSLMDFSRPKACLLADSPIEHFAAHSLSQLPIVGVAGGF